jgi:Collagenase and related proteases
MKIVVPLSNIDCYEPLVEAGADEFYCGFLPYEWLKKYKVILPINRRAFLAKKCSICTISSMKILSRLAEEYKIPVKIAFNSHYYIDNQYMELLEMIKSLMDLGFNTFIIADVGLAIYLRENGISCNIHLSGECEIINSMSMRFMEQLNISRFIFPRKTTMTDMRNSINNSGFLGKEYEAFILNLICVFSGAFCNSIHNDLITPTCNIPFHITRINTKNKRFLKIDEQLEEKRNAPKLSSRNNSNYILGKSGCGICQIRNLINSGITHVKVVGREFGIDCLVEDVKALKNIIGLHYQMGEDEDFQGKVRELYLDKIYPRHCYYPYDV